MTINEVTKQFDKFEGEAKKITLVSYPCYFLLPPDDDSPKTQKLTISASGQVSFSSTDFYFPPAKMSRGEWRKMTLEKGVAIELLNKIAEPFRTFDTTAYIADGGNWDLIITNTEDKKFKFSGPLFKDAFPAATSVSNLIRETLLMEDLFCFDGRVHEEITE